MQPLCGVHSGLAHIIAGPSLQACGLEVSTELTFIQQPSGARSQSLVKPSLGNRFWDRMCPGEALMMSERLRLLIVRSFVLVTSTVFEAVAGGASQWVEANTSRLADCRDGTDRMRLPKHLKT